MSASVLAACYFAMASITVWYTRFDGGVAFIWIATPLLVADLRYRPKSQWTLRIVACAVASIVATTLFGLGPRAALPMAVVNMAEAIGAAMLLRRFVPKAADFGTIRDVTVLLLVSGCLVPALSAFVGALVAHTVAGVPYGANWIGWFTAHALGAITITPLAMLVAGGDAAGWMRKTSGKAWGEAALHLLAIVTITVAVFAQARFPLLFLPFLPMMIATFRLGRLGAAASLLLLTAIGSMFTLFETGPIALIAETTGIRVQFFQLYLATATLIVLPAAAELTNRKGMYSKLQESAAFYQLLADRTGDIILALEVDGIIRFASPAIRKIGGFNPADVIGTAATKLVLADDVADVVHTHRQALSSPDETFMVEYQATRASGEIGWFESHMRAIIDDSGAPTGVVSIIREISGRKAKEQNLTEAAQTDPLTGLLNRRGFEDAYAREITTAGRTGGLAVFDLDHFKRVNDTFGHATGDLVLQEFAKILRDTVRASDVVGRLGGEEFVALLIGADQHQVRSVCDRVRVRFAATELTAGDGRSVHTTVSGGLAGVMASTPLHMAAEAADQALYRAKATGRNQLILAA